MKSLRALARAGAVLATAALLIPTGPASLASAKQAEDESVLIQVDSVSPLVPEPTSEPDQLVVNLTVTNTTSEELTGVHILAERGDPLGNQSLLDNSIANPTPPATGLPISPETPLAPLDLPPGVPTTVQFSTQTSTIDHLPGVCICSSPLTGPLIYPIFFTAHQLIDGVDNLEGVTSTYLPAFYAKPQPVRVSWVWPLLEPPHRFISDTEFTDDSLAGSVSTGRLANALAVVEQVGPQVPITLLIDPELLDELEVMSSGQYTVLDQDGKTTAPGTGQAAATEWLGRLRTVLQNDPKVAVKLTPYADPDVETLTEHHLTWSTAMPTAMAERVLQALAGRPIDSTLAWPATGAISKPTLRRLIGQGVNTVLLNASAVHVGLPDGALAPQLVRLEENKTVAAALLSPAIEKYAASAISTGGSGAAALPTLTAELAVRAAQQPDVPQSVTIAAPRYVDPDVGSAVNAILATSRSIFAAPLPLSTAVRRSTLFPDQDGQLANVPAARATDVPPPMLAAESAVKSPTGMKLARALLDTKDDQGAATLVAALPAAIQRAESSAWRNPDELDAASRYSARLNDEFSQLSTGVQFVGRTGSYTLGSRTSPLPITVSNTLPYAVRVRVLVGGAPGFAPKEIPVQTIESRSTTTFRVPAKTVRPGLFQIDVVLRAGGHGPQLGEPRRIKVRSTALGFIGVIIMIVAGSVLGIALLWRIIRRMRNRRASGEPPVDPVPIATPEPVS